MPYKHGAYGEIIKSKAIAAAQADTVAVYVGVAPIHLIKGFRSEDLVNTPIRLRNMNEVQNLVGYSDNWKKFGLCEVFTEHFNNTVENAGPIYIINVLDPNIHKGAQVSLANQDFTKGAVYLPIDDAIIDSVRVSGKVLGTDYAVDFDMASGQIVVKALTTLSAAETIVYDPVDLSMITESTIIGSSNADGSVSGIQAIKLLYTKFNAICNLLVAPFWSEKPAVYQAMVSAVQKINGHWDGFVIADIPIEDPQTESGVTVTSHEATVNDNDLIVGTVVVKNGSTVGVLDTDYSLSYAGGVLTVTLLADGALYDAESLDVSYNRAVDTKSKALAWKEDHGYTSERSKVCWPCVEYNGQVFHGSTVFAAKTLSVDLSHQSIPMESASNKQIMCTGQYFGASSKNPGYDQVESNDLNEQGISTFCYWNGQWVTWGPHTAAFKYGTTMDPRVIFDVNIRMLMFVTNGFQTRHGIEIDSPMDVAKKNSIVNIEQQELDRLKGLGAIIGDPLVEFVELDNPLNDMMNGDFVWDIQFTNTPPLKSATAKVCYTDAGFAAFFE